MAKCNYPMKVTGGVCGIEVEKDGEEKCYVHRCLLKNDKISNLEKFTEFLKKHSNYFSKPEYAQEFKIGFEFDFNHLCRCLGRNSFLLKLKFKDFKFYEKAKFEKITRVEELKLYNCVFFKEVTFENLVLQDKRYTGRMGGDRRVEELHHNIEKTIFHKECNFRNVVFNNVRFKDIDLSKCIFYGSRFNNCSFVNVKWFKKGKLFGRNYAFLDEEKTNRNDMEYEKKMSELERIYRDLKVLAKSA